MDLNRFGLRTRPFRTSPDVDGYYPATTHESALAELRRGIAEEEGLLLLTAEPGLGKTLLVQRLLEEIPEGIRSVFLTHGCFRDRAQLLQAILFDLGESYQEMTEQELRLALTDSCLEQFRNHCRTLIIVDEAHHLSPPLVEELRLLGNLEGKQGKAVLILLVGIPLLEQTIAHPGLEILRQRMTVRTRLEPFNVEESADYLLHQIRRAGGRPDKLLGEDVLDILSHAAKGIPRLLNQAAHLAFSLADENESSLVDAEAAVEAVSRLGLDDEQTEQEDASEPRVVETVPMRPPVTNPPLQISRVDGPPMYVYEGVDAPFGQAPEPPRVWQSNALKVG